MQAVTTSSWISRPRRAARMPDRHRWTLHPSHAWLYEPQGLQRLAEHLNPGGVFALWSNEPPDAVFCSAAIGYTEYSRALRDGFPARKEESAAQRSDILSKAGPCGTASPHAKQNPPRSDRIY